MTPGDRCDLDPLRLVRLLQLASPALPIGGYSYSQGLEWAIEAGWVHDEASAGSWIGDVLAMSVSRCEAPVLVRLLAAWRADDPTALAHWNAWFRASRDTAELLAETTQMGQALRRVLAELNVASASDLARLDRCAPVTLPLAYALAAVRSGLPDGAAVSAYIWAWAENQVIAAVKSVPLGQSAGQRLLHTLGAAIPQAVAGACVLPDDRLANFQPGVSLASCRHERQYTRLFRS